MDVLVTGGTGFVGREVVRQLRVSGHRVHLLVRNPEAPTTIEVAHTYSAKLRPGDVANSETLRHACADVDAVIHLVGIISEFEAQTFETVHVRGTQNMVFAAQDAQVRRFLHMSALGTRPNARSRYHSTKFGAEEKVRRSSLGWTIFRPSLIYGPGDGVVSLFDKIMRWSPVVPIVGRATAQFQPISVKSVASAFVRALAEPGTVGEVYDLCGPETLTLGEIVSQILKVTRRHRLKINVPPGMARAQAALMESIYPKYFHKPSPLSRDQLVMLREDNTGNGEPANRLFGLRPVTFKEGIAAYL